MFYQLNEQEQKEFDNWIIDKFYTFKNRDKKMTNTVLFELNEESIQKEVNRILSYNSIKILFSKNDIERRKHYGTKGRLFKVLIYCLREKGYTVEQLANYFNRDKYYIEYLTDSLNAVLLKKKTTINYDFYKFYYEHIKDYLS